MIQGFNFIANVGRILYLQSSNKKVEEIYNNHFPKWAKKSDGTCFLYNKACLDIYAGTIRDGKVCEKFFDHEKRVNMEHRLKVEGKNFSNTVVVILESPHIEEYHNDLGIPYPAMGKTGKKLDKYFQSVVDIVVKQSNSRLKTDDYKIILMESIPYQCSLGTYPLDDKIRDLIFIELWKQKCIKEDFIQRLSSYNPGFIFNFCTKGTSKQKLQDLVQEEIDKYHKQNQNVELYRGSHPSMWNFDIYKR